MNIDEIKQELTRLDFQVAQAYSNMKWCQDDQHWEGDTMWYSIALDREQERDQYHQKIIQALESVE